MNWSKLSSVFYNSNTGLGNANRDAIAGMGILSPSYLERQILHDASFHWAIRKAVEYIPKNAFAKGGTLQLGSEDGDRDIVDAVNYLVTSRNRVTLPDKPSLQVAKFFVKAQIEANRTGGCAILLDIDDGQDLSQPVNLDGIKQIRGLRIFNRFSIHPVWEQGYITGELDPEYYQILSIHNIEKAVGQYIHKSRILPFYGSEMPLDDISWLSDGWLGDSVIRQMLLAVARYDGSMSAVADRMQRFETPLLKIKGLLDNLNSDRRRIVTRNGTPYQDSTFEERIRQRAESVQAGWSVFRMLVADMENEEITTVSHTFAGVAPNIQAFRDCLVAASGLPETILFNRHANGLGQMEEGERAAAASLIEDCQQNQYHGNLETLLTYYFLSQSGVTGGELPDSWQWVWQPLWQPTEDEKAKAALTQAQTIKTIIDCSVQNAQVFGDTMPVLTNREIRESAFGGTEFGGLNVQLLEENPETQAVLLPPETTEAAEITTDAEDKYYPPEAAQNNAKKALKWREEHGEEVKAGTQVGWTRARQLASGEGLSLDIVKRMAQFNRHRKNSEVAPEYRDEPWKDNGYVAWLLWGGTSGVDWAIKTIESLENKEVNDYYQTVIEDAIFS